MLQKISLLSLACLLFTGCMSNEGTSPEEKKFRKVEAAASECAEIVKNQTIELTAEGQDTDTRWTTVEYVVPEQHTRTVEYRTSSVLDNGQPGKAWQACMSDKKALVPELKL
ncbi:hypothetical protein [Leclercia adecarboxylata]|uniref:hypothetical protein n=1 Tax=Leclercia adecarboxylata TaxID=83655 RepID=UPI00294A0D17|nr:hypothetical protein [Leclercia adecarboxylata]MDV5239314.1 hypothetical protein [Leclercia adecarboxylata]MDV5275878.1 hypothetical protein [Leclercia adecarboxylata]MDV5461538.1 hypothetical protein [Leclercia adecarboxylata]MDV5503314.1 hypothetical protein [Leclercia adecarboxylata]MDV5534468.1 hypothetical protein [Leclercia adecarboxylata]